MGGGGGGTFRAKSVFTRFCKRIVNTFFFFEVFGVAVCNAYYGGVIKRINREREYIYIFFFFFFFWTGLRFPMVRSRYRAALFHPRTAVNSTAPSSVEDVQLGRFVSSASSN